MQTTEHRWAHLGSCNVSFAWASLKPDVVHALHLSVSGAQKMNRQYSSTVQPVLELQVLEYQAEYFNSSFLCHRATVD